MFELLSHVQLFVTPWPTAHQAPLSFTCSQSLLRFMPSESWSFNKWLRESDKAEALLPFLVSNHAYRHISACLAQGLYMLSLQALSPSSLLSFLFDIFLLTPSLLLLLLFNVSPSLGASRSRRTVKPGCLRIQILPGIACLCHLSALWAWKNHLFFLSICFILGVSPIPRASLTAQLVKNPPAVQETLVSFLAWGDLLEKGQATHSSILGLPLWLSW